MSTRRYEFAPLIQTVFLFFLKRKNIDFKITRCLCVIKGRLFEKEERIHIVLSTYEKAALKTQLILKHFIVTYL